MRAIDRFVPVRHHSREMNRHLRLVQDSSEEAAYVIGRTKHIRPGTPYVIARCIDRVVASVFALSGQQVRTRAELLLEPPLAEALRAWEADDTSLFREERQARSAYSRRWHPSSMGNAQP
jgi:hypothetical protein